MRISQPMKNTMAAKVREAYIQQAEEALKYITQYTAKAKAAKSVEQAIYFIGCVKEWEQVYTKSTTDLALAKRVMGIK